MLIASKFHDFYDKVLGHTGVDKTVVYRRFTEKFPSKLVDLGYEELKSKKTSFTVHKYVIGFCGKLYPVVEFRRKLTEGFASRFFYDFDKLRVFTAKHLLKIKSGRVSLWYNHYDVMNDAEIKKFFDPNNWKELLPVFRDKNAPIFICGKVGMEGHHMKNALYTNPCLKDYQFFKAVDPVSAFQGLYMYISGVLGTPVNPTVKLSDKEMAKKRGHDGKYSFKKLPSDKKGKKK